MVLCGFVGIMKNPEKYGLEPYSTGFRGVFRGAQEGNLYSLFIWVSG